MALFLKRQRRPISERGYFLPVECRLWRFQANFSMVSNQYVTRFYQPNTPLNSPW
jgi:hypothetical protein